MWRLIHTSAGLLGGVLCAAVAIAGASVGAQGIQKHFEVPTGVGATVSVATLRIPEKAWRHFAKAKQAADHNRLAESDRETQKAIAIAPDFAAAYLLRATSLIQANRLEEAIQDIQRARQAEPGLMWTSVVLAGAYNGLHRYEEARLELRALHGAEAESWQAAYEAARAAIGLRDVDAGLRWSALALRQASTGFPDAYLVRANALILSHRWSDAASQMERYLQTNGPLEHRSQVLSSLEIIKRRALDEERNEVASR